MTKHLTRAELQAGLPGILDSLKDDGVLEAIVVRPRSGERLEVESREISPEGGVHGDHWAKGCWMSTEDGRPHPDVQICIMNARCMALVAGERARWPLAGDNLMIDLDLSPENLPPGQRLQIGSATIEITAVPHTGCKAFASAMDSPRWSSSTGPRAGRFACAASMPGSSRMAASRSAIAWSRRNDGRTGGLAGAGYWRRTLRWGFSTARWCWSPR